MYIFFFYFIGNVRLYMCANVISLNLYMARGFNFNDDFFSSHHFFDATIFSVIFNFGIKFVCGNQMCTGKKFKKKEKN